MNRVGSHTLSLEWIALWLTAVASGGVYAIRIVIALTGLDAIPGAFFVPFLPGVVVGIWRFITVYSRARIPFTAVTLVMFGGLLWTLPSEFNEGSSQVMVVVMAMSVSLLYNSRQRWVFGAKWFCIGAVVSSVPLLISFFTSNQPRLGEVYVDHLRIMDANNVGILYAVAIVAQLAVVWNYGLRKPQNGWLPLLLCGWFLSMIVLTSSRGALVTLVAAIGVFLVMGRSKWNRTIILAGSVIVVLAIGVYWGINGPPAILSRFTSDTVGTLGNRTPLWRSALDHMNQWDPIRALFGEGTGSARYVLGEQDPSLARFMDVDVFFGSEDGIPRLSPHSSFVDWVLTYGAVGATVGALILFNAFANCWRVDLSAPGAASLAFLTIFLLTAATTVIHAMSTDTIACSGIALGHIYMNITDRRDPATLVLYPDLKIGRFSLERNTRAEQVQQ